MALLDLGCTWCFRTVKKLGLRLRKLRQPMGLSQLDGSLMGGAPATCLMELVSFRAGTHAEAICFIVVPRMTKTMVLELAWLKKWNPIGRLGQQQMANEQRACRGHQKHCTPVISKVSYYTKGK